MSEPDLYLLTKSEAAFRSSVLSSISYKLRLTLSPEDCFAGILEVNFTISDALASIWLDFKGTEVSSVSINSVLAPVFYSDSKLYLSGLVPGENSVTVCYQNVYSHDGLGLHYFKDPEDSKVYIHSQFEPFAANRAFPCFDQPDLKATWELIVKVPESWRVLSNEPIYSETSETAFEMPTVKGYLGGAQKICVFQGKYKISTYLYAICAGEYSEYRSDNSEIGIPLGLYCRQSLAKYFDPGLYFSWIIEGFKFYQDFFGYTYPFTKYDGVFAPEFNSGAMENVGCVTYRDEYIYKDPPTQVQLIRVCDTFLHEMAHMWFGDLVTMKWWDDLWLNESFATFMASLAIDSQLHQSFPEAWMEFLGEKGWGYATDQLSTTHPIFTEVKDTNEADSNFDGISYSKGAAVLKQLYFVVGANVFKAAVSKYLKFFEFRNAEFADLIRFIDEEVKLAGGNVNILAWADSWVKTAGLNELAPVIERAEGNITSFKVFQRPALEEHAALRYHNIEIEVFDSEMNSIKREPVTIFDREYTEIECFNRLPACAAILNVGDWGYCKIRIDETSLALLRDKLGRIKDPLSRQLVYRALWDMTRDVKLSAVEFLEFVIAQLPSEPNSSIANYALEISSSALAYYIPDCPVRDLLAHQLFDTVLEKIKTSSQEDASIYKKMIFSFLHHTSDIQLAVSWIETNSTGVQNLTLGKSDRWAIIRKYAQISENAKTLVQQEFNSDPSDTSNLARIYCESAYPNLQNKERVWENLMNNGEKLSRYEREEVMTGFNIETQGEVLKKFAELFFRTAIEIVIQKDKEYSKDFCEYLVPTYLPEDQVIQSLEELIQRVPQDRFDIERGFKEQIDYLKRFRDCKECSRKYIASLT